MPRFDFKCPACGLVRPDVWVSLYRLNQPRIDISPCEQCSTRLERQPSAPAFVVKGYRASTGYSTKD